MNAIKRITIILLAAVFLPGMFTAHLDAKQKRKLDKLKFPALNEIQKPEVKKESTGNGIKLRLIQREKLPIVDLIMLIKGGDAFDPKDQVGLSTITSELLRIGGTKDMKPEDVDKVLDAKGISINVNSSDDYYVVNISCLKENLDEAVSIMSKMLREPAFDEDKLEEIKAKLSSSISRRNDNPSPIRGREFRKIIYGSDSPYAAVLEYEHLDNIDRAALVRHHKKFFAPASIMAGLTGPLDIARFKEIMEKYFGDWNAQVNIPDSPTIKEPTHDFKVGFVQKDNLNQSYISLGHLGIKYDAANAAKLRVFNYIFSSGFASRLVTRIRVKMGLTYGAGGGIGTRQGRPGITSFTTYTKCENTQKAIDAMLDEIDIIRKEKVTEEELKLAKEAYLNSYVFQFSSPDRVLQSRLIREFYGIDENIVERMMEDVRNVTADDILQVAQEYLHPDKIMFMVVGHKDKLDGDLSKYGKVKNIDISVKPPALKEKIPAPTPETLAKGKAVIDSLLQNKYKGYKKLKTIIKEVNVNREMMGRKMDMGMKITQLYPGKTHIEMTMMGMKILMIIDGDKGMISAMGRKQPMPGSQLENGKFSDTYNILLKPENYKYQYLKEETIDGKTFDVVYIFNQKKDWLKYFIDKETGYVVYEETLSKERGVSGVTRTVNSDFRMINGIAFSFKSETYLKDKKIGDTVVKKVTVNPKVDPAIFKIEE